jgi:hypothetical protein
LNQSILEQLLQAWSPKMLREQVKFGSLVSQ